MQYRRDKSGRELSVLGFGCMRFTKKGNTLDIDKAEQEILAAFRAGVNYYDTAYIYPGSEDLLGTVLERNGIRDQVYQNRSRRKPRPLGHFRKARRHD